ncbi:LysR family transcriptional regulator [Pseudoalteromonas sp. SR43-6]|jgi:LysR family glycine cleavage system transcriptional activator|uniref:LysR family transcriptional regulator n=1 Tax=Pseudoalteromonas distincta TaxID=77608 RepID=F3BN02_9GAMM|nr:MULTISPECIES: LysR family transcriptional regulator [Pseudoalteromonas]EGI72020.1 transcriptional regulator (positive) of LysR [Pseudoalteromonas distincta]KAA1161551.1 LysR family transcriptional regulator [Pseudoalteromonas distincta]MBB1287864.1 LysR family transcriptional regulator [Pseudoalteromonas sp. SR41-5]MBB1330747.1 LysR family transcriptional regulator [Pseudoalteromonas sp. SR43-7]MBB1344673.1 LysR family transcriptional regulator [Pseudoalteromonas sp. SG45-2]|tara:strand:- start:43863 stop:44744 length:882 start_codon:yes stop_codon:yes gene_type:complete
MQTPIRGLRSFCFAARSLSFKHAANELYLTPSAVSHQIKQLEEQLGIELFQRKTRSISLTTAGKNFFDAVSPIITMLESTINEFSQMQQNTNLTITLPEFFASELLMPKLSEWTSEHPNINLQMDTLKTRKELTRHSDLSIVLSSGKPTEGLATELFNLEYIPACNKKLLDQWRDDHRQALNQVPLILHKARPWAWHQWAEKAGIDDFSPSQIIQIDSMFGVARAAQQGMGIALIPLPISQSWLDEQWLYKLFEQPLTTKDKYYLVQHESSTPNHPLDLFAKWVVNTFRKIQE